MLKFRLALLILLPALTGYLTYLFIGSYFFGSNLQKSSPIQYVEVLPGKTFDTVCQELAEKNLVKSPLVPKIISFIRGETFKFEIGEYQLEGNLSPLEILKKLSSGKTHKRTLEIKHGENIRKVADRFVEAGLRSQEEIIQAYTDQNLIQSFNIPASSIEGYLAPGMYSFSKIIPLELMFTEMINKRREIWNLDLLEKAGRLNMTQHSVLILASLIEAINPPENQIGDLSSVLHNRIRENLTLNSPESLAYALGKNVSELNESDKQNPSDYNLYTKPGLPPGPINNPGDQTILAALLPNDTNFISYEQKDGTLIFIAKEIPEEAESAVDQ